MYLNPILAIRGGTTAVAYPNVDAVAEMVNLLSATRSYEANLTVIDAAKSLMLRALEI